MLNGSGAPADENRVKAILEIKQPEIPEELRRFLGLVACVSKFIPGQSQTTAPLRDLLHNEAVWTWTPAQAQAFLQLKQLVATTPVIAYYSQRGPTIVSADASSHGVGAVLLQIQEEGRRVPIMYSSRALTATEQKYSQIEKTPWPWPGPAKSSIVICLELKCRS